MVAERGPPRRAPDASRIRVEFLHSPKEKECLGGTLNGMVGHADERQFDWHFDHIVDPPFRFDSKARP